MTEWSKDKEKRVLWKYRFSLTARIIRVVLILLFLYGVYMILLSIGYDFTKLDDKNAYHLNLAIDWTQPGLQGEYSRPLSGEITPFLSQTITIPISRTIGKEEQIVGEWDVTKRLVNSLSSKETIYFQRSSNQQFGFILPEDPRTGKKLAAVTKSVDLQEWQKLEMVHEGTVANLAFSTSNFLKSEELLGRLEKYDLDVQWMPLYAGELKAFKPAWTSTGGGENISVDTLGLTRAVEMDEDYMSWSMLMLDSKTIKKNQEIMLKNMKDLIEDESETYRQNVLGLWYLEERYDYLKENGFLVYGAVVTGPVKELLKLKEEPDFRNIQVGEFEYWNWTTE
ncbi:anti sigma factor C-terminal domain-containing protein [Bacillus sp. 1P02SD]|uniref:anti-sigma factor n=1 Tax=Bacillus sp. 1P02SD TaxID=3132264 RepID=UPI0039A0277F